MKTCTKCNQVKELKDFGIDKNSKFGRASKCKFCNNALIKEKRDLYKLLNPVPRLRAVRTSHPIIDGKKLCRLCNETKPIEQYNINKRMISGYHTECKYCTNAERFIVRRKKGIKIALRIKDIIVDDKRSCTICKEVKHISLFRRTHDRNPTRCIECSKIIDAKNRIKEGVVPRLPIFPEIDGYKKCNKCFEVLTVSRFSYQSHQCKLCVHGITRESRYVLRKEQFEKDHNNLTNNYIKTLLVKHDAFLSAKDIPEELIEVKRKQVKLKRKIDHVKED
jgi:hypothetical protein